MLMTKQYDDIYDKERRHSYPVIDVFERSMGYAINRDKLEYMARTLACPLKVNAPNWQHGRVIYSVAMRYFNGRLADPSEIVLDVGTAKGFSACVLSHAIADSGSPCDIVSVDVIDPDARIVRNSAAEVYGLMNVHEFVAEHVAPGVSVSFLSGGSTPWLKYAMQQNKRVPFAFIDGKHTYDAVHYEAAAIALLQRTGDIVIFDDCQIAPVGRAVADAKGYDISYVNIGPRIYAVAVRV